VEVSVPFVLWLEGSDTPLALVAGALLLWYWIS
jgi:hypothetical protein